MHGSRDRNKRKPYDKEQRRAHTLRRRPVEPYPRGYRVRQEKIRNCVKYRRRRCDGGKKHKPCARHRFARLSFGVDPVIGHKGPPAGRVPLRAGRNLCGRRFFKF